MHKNMFPTLYYSEKKFKNRICIYRDKADIIVNYQRMKAQAWRIKNHPEIKHDKFWSGHIWSHSYYMSTLGNMSKETVRMYIQNQYSK